jgi:hypothetical protein
MSHTAGSKAHDGKYKYMAFLQQRLETKGNLKNSGIEFFKLSAAALVGAGIGSAVGRPSILVSIPTIIAGKYYDSDLVTAAGIGMMTGGTLSKNGLNGTEANGLEGAKERVKAFGQDLKERLYLNKIKAMLSKAKTKSEGTNGTDGTDGTDGMEGTEGLDRVSYFEPSGNLEVGSLENMEREIERQAQIMETKQFAGYEDLSFKPPINY